MEFKEQVICRRKQLGLSQEQLGDKIGVTRQTVSKWELGETTPDMDKLILLAKLFGTSIDELVGNESDAIRQESLCMMRNALLSTSHYEYKSKKSFKGLPLIHINFGSKMYKAKGVIAIGNSATGLIAIGLVAVGLISLGVLPIGLIAIGAIALGIFAAGGVAAGVVSAGGIAVGVLALGGIALGMYSAGGIAIADKIAMGGYARGEIAIGDKTKGDVVFDIHKNGQSELIRKAIIDRFPSTHNIILKFFT